MTIKYSEFGELIYWNAVNTRTVTKVVFDFFRVRRTISDAYQDTEDMVAHMMQSSVKDGGYDDVYARHNIKNAIYRIDRNDYDACYMGVAPVWINKSIIEIVAEVDHTHNGQKGLLTSIDEYGCYHGTWGEYAIDPERCILEIWNDEV